MTLMLMVDCKKSMDFQNENVITSVAHQVALTSCCKWVHVVSGLQSRKNIKLMVRCNVSKHPLKT